MNLVSQEIIESYQVRRTQKQKTGFINYYVQQLAESGIETNVEKGGLLNHRNIHIGNLEKAQFVFTAHYDTAPIRILLNAEYRIHGLSRYFIFKSSKWETPNN